MDNLHKGRKFPSACEINFCVSHFTIQTGEWIKSLNSFLINIERCSKKKNSILSFYINRGSLQQISLSFATLNETLKKRTAIKTF